MKKIIKLTEFDLVRLIKRVIKEQDTSTEYEHEVFPSKGKAYHLTPDINLNHIMSGGLVPKSESKLRSHAERIYMFLVPDSEYKDLAKDLWNSSQHKEQIKNYYLLEIDINQLPDHRFYGDPQTSFEYLGVYTNQSIPPSAIKVIGKIPTEEFVK
jgi:hypothetical protein